MKPLFNLIIWLVAGAVLALLAFSLLQPQASNNANFTAPPAPPSNATPPPANYTPPQESKVFLTLIDTADCGKCVNGTQALEETKTYLDGKNNIRVVSAKVIDLFDPEAQFMLEKYQIKQLPALVVSGNATYPADFITTWEGRIGTRESDGAFVSRMFPAPYYDLDKGRVVGMVQGIAIDPYGCPECASASGFLYTLEDPSIGNVYFVEKKLLEENGSEAQELIAKYGIKRLPTVLLSSEISDYTIFPEIANLNQTGDGWYIVRNVRPPYAELGQNRTIRGLVDAIMIINSSCIECFDINSISDMIISPGGTKVIALRNKTSYDITDPIARSLVEKYNITMLPTVLYSPEVSIYPNFEEFWKAQNNTIESDGWYAFRAHRLVGLTYQNISG